MEDGRLQTPTVLNDRVKNHFGLARLNPEIIAHLYPLDLQFQTLGVREGDPDPLLEAVRFVLATSAAIERS